MAQIRLNDRLVGNGCPPFIVAEAGINHNGDLQTAFKMIKVAKEAGVEAIKFQTFKAEEFVVDSKKTYTYKLQGNEVTESMLEMFKRYEFSRDEWYQIKKKCNEVKIMFFSTPQNRTDLNLLLQLGIPAIKVGSDDFTYLPLLKDYSSTGLPMIVSCGMADLEEVRRSLNTIGSLNGYPTILVLTTSQYPTPPEDVNLLKFTTLSMEFPTIPLGFSDHTQGPFASCLAIAFGCVYFEKHFTLDHNMPGPDHWFSEEPTGLKTWSDSIKQSYIMLGDRVVRPTKAEQDARIVFRRSIVSLCDIKKGDLLNSTNLGIRRPGNGLPPKLLEEIMGKKAQRDLPKGSILQSGDFG